MAPSARFFAAEVLTVGLAVLAAWLVHHQIPFARPVPAPAQIDLPAGLFIGNPADDPVTARVALEHAFKTDELVVFGSSEMTETAPIALQMNYPGACGQRVLTIGRAGFQSLPIALTLAGVREWLNPSSRVAIILSPGWFAERGTPSEAFLRFLEPFKMAQLMRKPDVPAGVRRALAREIRIHRDELTGLYPDWLYPTWPALARLSRDRAPDLRRTRVIAAPAVKREYDWDYEERTWRALVTARAHKNPYGVTSDYWEKIKSHKLPKPAPRLDPFGTERADVAALSELLRDRGVRATFIVQPIHRRIYRDLEPYDRLFADVERQLTADGHRVISYFKEPFDLTVLKDIAHFTEASWVRVARELCP